MRRMRPHEIALVIIATIAVLAAAKLAADFLVPVVAGVLLALCTSAAGVAGRTDRRSTRPRRDDRTVWR